MSLEGKNILVTGASGLIGAAVVELLLTHYPATSVFALVRDEQKARLRFCRFSECENLHIIVGDVCRPLQSDLTFHYIIHAAGNANPNAYALDPVGTMWTTLSGTYNLLQYGCQHGVERFLYVSSGEVYGIGDNEQWTEPEAGYVDTMDPRSCYPSAKRAAETMCACFAQQHQIDIVVCRPCHTYGPYFTEKDNRAYAQFIRNARAHENIVLKSKGEQYRSWIFVEDCAEALIHVLLKGESGQVYNVADRESNVTIRTMAELIADIAGVRVVFDVPTTMESKGFSKQKRTIFNTDKLENLDWRPKYSLREGLEKAILCTK